jgi:hypothetical protein
MSRYLISGLGIGGVALFACVTEPCGCTPALGLLVVEGIVTGADQEPIPGARVALGEGESPCPTVDALADGFIPVFEATTDVDGGFLADLYSAHGGTERCIILRVAAGVDTTMTGREARFEFDGPPDTLRVAVAVAVGAGDSPGD